LGYAAINGVPRRGVSGDTGEDCRKENIELRCVKRIVEK
jgi:hypothetical protein